MSKKANNGAAADSSTALVADPTVRYTPLAEADEISLSVKLVANTLAVRTRTGCTPSSADIIKFMMLCKSRRLNPFVGDAYLVGYDSKDGPVFSLITAIQALRKRAEGHPQFDGCRRGVILEVTDGDDSRIECREGAFFVDGETLLGGWAEVLRKDKSIPFRETVKLATYNTERSRWAVDPGCMIAKVAEAASLRRAFPSDLAGMYIRDEFSGDATPTIGADRELATALAAPTLNDLAAHVEAKRTAHPPITEQRDAEPTETQEAVAVTGGALFDKAPQAHES